MFEHEKRIEIERHVLKAGDDRAKAGLPPANPDSQRMIAAHDLEREIEAKRRARDAQRTAAPRSVHPQTVAPRAVAPVVRPSQAPAKPPTKPVSRPLAAVKPPVPNYLAVERARVCKIIAATPAGAEAERDEAIATGASVETFQGILAGRAILDGMKAGR